MSDDARPDRDDSDTRREGEAPATSLDSDVSHDTDNSVDPHDHAATGADGGDGAGCGAR